MSDPVLPDDVVTTGVTTIDGVSAGTEILSSISAVGSEWTVFARVSPVSAKRGSVDCNPRSTRTTEAKNGFIE